MTTEPRALRPGRRVATHAVMIALAAFAVIPILWMYVIALRPPDEALSQSLLPTSLSLDNLRHAFALVPLGDILLNTTLMAAAVTVGQLLTSLLAAYAFGCWSFRGDRVLFVAFVASWLIPFQVIMVPNYVLLSHLGLLNSLAGVIVPQLTAAFAVLLLRQHMRGFPRELLEAARMDGLGSWTTLWRVVVPSMRAPLSALAILLFVTAWNEYLWPRIVLQHGTSVVQTGLQGFLSDAGNDYGGLMAAAGVVTLPVLVLYVLLQRHVVDAFMRSGLR